MTPAQKLRALLESKGIYKQSLSLMKQHVVESATSGATGAASIATVTGGLGVGFDPHGDKGIYQNTKHKSKKHKAKPLVIKRDTKF